MFNKLREAIGSFSVSLKEKLTTREIKGEDLETPLQELVLRLAEADVAYEVAEKIARLVKDELVGKRIDRKTSLDEAVRRALSKAIMRMLVEPGYHVVEIALKKCREKRKPYVIVFMGVNGVGKTTSIAKIARLFQKAGITPVIVAADTFRAGAQEQLALHARRLGVPIIKAKYRSDPAAVAYDAIAFAEKRNYCAVLIDTAGRMHTDRDLIEELRKIIRVAMPDLKLLVVDALTGQDALEQALRYDNAVGVDGFILTKVDADAKGGTAVSITGTTGKPIFYIGLGQGYDDIEEFRAGKIVERIMGADRG